ncbi:hypothetical protein [Marinilabilia rubra]|uniref:PHP domain-containing protein n=1 Tax=Marinilabilia rubra TaxID=2162893 RepID=A0A2U2B616_9BACT|nr:hypothetical protein [Marinilabilia rubra]PWD98482.1 hypothetical protein DDZ16_15495 [Marinilabilia rubra]
MSGFSTVWQRSLFCFSENENKSRTSSSRIKRFPAICAFSVDQNREYTMKFVDYFKSFDPNQSVSNPGGIPKVNNHLHTPHSFSAFESEEEVLGQASEEGVSVVGVNDFFSFDAYQTWCDESFRRGLFPLFNIEFIGLSPEDEANGHKVNDPGNPGRVYFSGKGLAHPVIFSQATLTKLDNLRKEGNEYVREMTSKVNKLMASKGYNLRIDFDQMKKELAQNLVRERHLARAIRLLGEQIFNRDEEKISFFSKLMGTEVSSSLDDEAGLENEIRGSLLKAGKPAYVPENPEGFPAWDTIREIILDAGGIPTYPFLADAVKGYTDFERDKSLVAKKLKERGVWSVEFIPTRNDHGVLKEYAMFLRDEGFVVSFGTEHNSPGKQPVEVMAKGEVPLDEELQKINYEGACIIAAHQYLLAKNGKGVLNEKGEFKQQDRASFSDLGNKLILSVINKKQKDD